MVTDTINIVLQLFLVVGGGVMVALLAILLIILAGALGAWLAIQISAVRDPSSEKR
jgi:hypothetical protein